MKAHHLLMCAVAAGAAAACTATPAAKTVGCVMECVAIGQPMVVGKLTVVPREVLEDSRCPRDVQCVWAGRVRLNVDVTSSTDTEDEFTYRVELASDEPLGLFGGMLQLADVAPAPVSNLSFGPGDYRFGFTFAPDMMAQPATLAQ